MADDVLINKSATVERCVARAHEEYARGPASFATDFTRQDAAILNVQRACEAVLDMGQHIVRREGLGVPQGTRDIFELMARAGWIDAALADALKRTVASRNIAVHETIRVCCCPFWSMLLQGTWMSFWISPVLC
jgi:uncharacterized protein YutE (UPF0331/DUF86 family)